MRLFFPCILFHFLPLIGAQTSDSFIYPPIPGPNGNFSRNLVWELGSVVTLKWMTDFPEYNLVVLQNNDVAAGLPGYNAGGVTIG
jgi:hypothetical protein